MSRFDGEVDLPRTLLVALGLSVAVAVVVAATTSTAAFDPFNPSWDGTTDLRDAVDEAPAVEGELVRDPAQYAEVQRDGTVAFVIPDEDRTGEAAEPLGEFVRGGGTLVVFENFGDDGNELLAEVGAEARTDGQVIRDENHYYRSPTMPIATEVENESLGDDVDEVTFNYGTTVDPGNATVLVSTSEFAYLVDDPDDGLEDADSDFGPHPVATVEDVGEGQVIVVGDPSIAINAMQDVPDNAAFLETLYAGEEHVLFDLPGSDDAPPLAAALLTVRETPQLQTLLGALAVGGVAVLATWRVRAPLERARRWLPRSVGGGRPTDEPESPGLSDAERAAVLRRRHPDWDEERIERVIAALTRDGVEEVER